MKTAPRTWHQQQPCSLDVDGVFTDALELNNPSGDTHDAMLIWPLTIQCDMQPLFRPTLTVVCQPLQATLQHGSGSVAQIPGLEQDPTETPSTATSSSGTSDRLSCDFLSPWPGCPKTHDEPGRLAAAEELALVGQLPRADMQKYIELCKDIFQVGSLEVLLWQNCSPALGDDMEVLRKRLSLQPSR